MPIKNRFAELDGQIAEWRQDFHRNPELLFDTIRTSEKVSDLLRQFGCDEVVAGIGRTGVVGTINGQSDRTGRVIGLRADMDALPIPEDTGLEYSSRNNGVMHACGHDGHTAMLLGAAKYLAETRNFDGTVAVIFQPAEEGGGGGKEMVDDGLMDRFGIQEVYGMHNMPSLPIGEFSIRSGAFFAAADQFTITVRGQGGHAASPHTGADSAVTAAQIVIALQTIVSRNIDPVKSLVVSVTSIRTLTDSYNVIPDATTIKGTVRSLASELQDLAERRIDELATSTAAAMGLEARVDYNRGYPVMVNSDAETGHAIAAAEKVTGQKVIGAPVIMGSEDFSFMLQERPGAYILLGNGGSAQLHNPKYNFNDEASSFGCSWWAELVESRLPAS